jgi:glycosyltransferase involved in cell wall biosynthesis
MDLSVIIPVYNAEALLDRCLNSIFDQQDFDFSFEVITVNDGSKDNSLQKLKEVQQQHPEIKVIDQINNGAGTARNTGLNAATGKYIWFIDIDDYIEPGAFSALQKKCISGTGEKTFGFNYNKVTSAGQKTQVNKDIAYQDVETLAGIDYLYSNKPYYLWVILYQRSIIEQNKFRFINGIKNIEDLEFSIRYFNVCPQVEYHNLWLYNYFENEGSTSRNRSRENLLKLASDTLIVHESISKLIGATEIKHNREVIKNIFNISIAGFFFSLVQNPYTISETKEFYTQYRKKGLIPIPVIKINKKFRLFSSLLNNRSLFFMLLFFMKKIKR